LFTNTEEKTMPRPRKSNDTSGLLVGAALGGAIADVPGAILGGILGAAFTPLGDYLPLSESVNKLLHERGLTLQNIQRSAKNGINVLFYKPDRGYFSIHTIVPFQTNMSVADLENALYDKFHEELNNWIRNHG
jgi:hypothetical protein